MEKNIKISILLDTYGKMLTEKQYKLLDDYYNNDLSLSEIAENENITRQAVNRIKKRALLNLRIFLGESWIWKYIGWENLGKILLRKRGHF